VVLGQSGARHAESERWHGLYQKILLTLDGSALSRAAITHAQRVAADSNVEIVVLEVVRPLEMHRLEVLGQIEFTRGDPQVAEEIARSIDFEHRSRAEADVTGAREELEASGVRSVRTLVEEGLAGNVIVDVADREGVDAIVMATRGHGGLGREVVGSVAEYVLRHAGNAAVILVGPRAANRTARTADRQVGRIQRDKPAPERQ